VIPASVRIFVCQVPQDMRRSFDGLSLAASEHLGEDAGSGALFVFANKRKNRLKVLWFDGNAHCILNTRLHRRRFELPSGRTIDARTLSVIMRGVESARASAR
jgi:transposase